MVRMCCWNRRVKAMKEEILKKNLPINIPVLNFNFVILFNVDNFFFREKMFLKRPTKRGVISHIY